MEFNPSAWVTILRTNPVLLVLIGGLVGGIAFTQTVKVLCRGWQLWSTPVSDARYASSLYILSIVSSLFFTNRLWEFLIGWHGSGLRHIVALIAGLASPYVFQGGRALIAWKFNRKDSQK